MSRHLIAYVILTLGVLSSSPVFASVLISAVATDGALGTTSIATAGGQKLIEDTFGKHLVVYVDSSGLLGVAFANGDPTLPGAWTVAKSQKPVSPYARPAAVLVSPTSLRIVAEGGSGNGRLVDVPVSISRDSTGNISGVAFGVRAVLDNSGYALYPSAIVTHDGGIVLVWNARQSGVVSKINSLRWTLQNGWTSVANPASTSPDTVIMDKSNTYEMIVSVIERQDNFELYVVGDRAQSSPSTTLVFNSAAYNGQSWAWGSQNLAYETNASRGLTDATSVAWDPVQSLVVVAYDVSYSICHCNAYGVFTIDGSDRKVHVDTPNLDMRDNDWGTIIVDQNTGNYYLFMMDSIVDEGPGKVEYIVYRNTWNATQTIIDSEDTNLGISVERTTTHTIDIVYSKGTSAPTAIEFARLGPFNSPNFRVTPTPTSLKVQAGSSGNFTITVASLYGFTGTVNIATTASPPGLIASLGTANVTLTSGGTATSTLTVSSTTSGNYTAIISATSGSLSNSASLPVTVTDFTVSSIPASVTGNTGTTATSTIVVAPINGFAGTVNLTFTTNSTSISCTLSSMIVATGSGTSALTCTGSAVANYTLTVTGASGTLSHSTAVVFHAQDFFITTDPTSVTVNVGVTSSSTITVVPINGFTGTVFLAVTTNSTNISCALSSTSVAGGSGTSMSCTGGVAAHYLATVTGTIGSLSHSANMTFDVNEGPPAPPDFVISASPSNMAALAGSTGTSTITVLPVNEFNGTVDLAITTNSTSLTCALTNTIVTGGSGTSILSCTGSPEGNYLATVTSTSGTLSHFVTVVFSFQDFTIAASASRVTVNAGSIASSTIIASSVNGFSGTVTLASSVSPAGLTCSLNPNTINGGTSQTSTLSCAGTAGFYTVTVNGSSGSLSHTATVTVVVQPVPADLTKTINSESDIAPESQQHTFRDPRGLQGYYVFYRQTVAGLDRCYYAYSADGVSWAVNQTISDLGSYSGMRSCSATYREDPINNQLVVYVVFTKHDTVVGTTHSIRFAMGFIPDNALAISWSSSGLVRDAQPTEQMAYATIARANDGYLHIAAAYVIDNPGSTNDHQTVIVCSSNTPDPTTNPAWTCSIPSLVPTPFPTLPFAGTTSVNVTRPSYMPEVIPGLSGHDVLIISGPCMGNEYLTTCISLDTTEQSRVLDWDGTTQTWGSLASFAPSPGSPGDRRSATVNPVSGRVHYAYQDGTSRYVSRYLDSPYSSWSAAATITTITSNGQAGLHLSLVFTNSSQTLFAFYVLPINGGIFSRNATDLQFWGPQQIELTNSTFKYKVVSSQSLVDGTKVKSIPYVWIVSARVTELWFKIHVVPTPAYGSASATGTLEGANKAPLVSTINNIVQAIFSLQGLLPVIMSVWIPPSYFLNTSQAITNLIRSPRRRCGFKLSGCEHRRRRGTFVFRLHYCRCDIECAKR